MIERSWFRTLSSELVREGCGGVCCFDCHIYSYSAFFWPICMCDYGVCVVVVVIFVVVVVAAAAAAAAVI